jgi:hypothetical protein
MGLWSDWHSRNAGQENSLINAEFVLKKIDELPEMSETVLGLIKLNVSYTFTGVINVPTPNLPS